MLVDEGLDVAEEGQCVLVLALRRHVALCDEGVPQQLLCVGTLALGVPCRKVDEVHEVFVRTVFYGKNVYR